MPRNIPQLVFLLFHRYGHAATWELPGTGSGGLTIVGYAAVVTERLAEALRLFRENLRNAVDSASRWCNNKAKRKAYVTGDRVRVYFPRRVAGRSPEWQSLYKTEGVIVKKLNDATYVVTSKS